MHCTRLKNNVSFIFHQITNIGDYQLSIYRILAPILLIHVATNLGFYSVWKIELYWENRRGTF